MDSFKQQQDRFKATATDSKKQQQKKQKWKGNPNSKVNANFWGDEVLIGFKKANYKKPQKNKPAKGAKYQNDKVTKNIKKKGSDDKSLAFVWITRLFYIALVLGFIYIVDFEKFAKLRNGASYCLNQTVSFLPPVVVKQGEMAVEYIRPVAMVTVNKLNVLVNDTSTFFNTNPLIKDHWTNIREISSICSARLVDYMRTLYTQTTGYCLDFKNKLF